MLKLRLLNKKYAMSVIIGTIIVVALAIAAAIPIFIYAQQTTKTESPPITIVLDIEYDDVNNIVTIEHKNGDPIFEAYTSDEINYNWYNLRLKIEVPSGTPPNVETITGDTDLSLGSEITVKYDDAIPSGSTIKVLYIPAQQTITSILV